MKSVFFLVILAFVAVLPLIVNWAFPLTGGFTG